MVGLTAPLQKWSAVNPADLPSKGGLSNKTALARIRVGQRNLLIGRGKHLLVDRFQTLHLGRQLGKLLLEVRRLRSEGFRWFLQVGGVELAQIPRHALLDLSKPALHLRAGEILVAIVDRFELIALKNSLASMTRL